jgi:hypothetical protein
MKISESERLALGQGIVGAESGDGDSGDASQRAYW